MSRLQESHSHARVKLAITAHRGIEVLLLVISVILQIFHTALSEVLGRALSTRNPVQYVPSHHPYDVCGWMYSLTPWFHVPT